MMLICAAVMGTEAWIKMPGAVRFAQAGTLPGTLPRIPQRAMATVAVLAVLSAGAPRCNVADVIVVVGNVESTIV